MNSQLQLFLLFEKWKKRKSNGSGGTPQKFTAVVEGKLEENQMFCSTHHSKLLKILLRTPIFISRQAVRPDCKE